MNVSQRNRAPGLRRAASRSDQQTLMQRAQVKSSVEAITERRQITRRILPEVERMVGPRQAGLEITENGVDPFELGDVFGFASGHDRGLMATTRLGDGPEARQSIGEDYAGGVEMVFRPDRNRLEGEAGDRRQLDAQRARVGFREQWNQKPT